MSDKQQLTDKSKQCSKSLIYPACLFLRCQRLKFNWKLTDPEQTSPSGATITAKVKSLHCSTRVNYNGVNKSLHSPQRKWLQLRPVWTLVRYHSFWVADAFSYVTDCIAGGPGSLR